MTDGCSKGCLRLFAVLNRNGVRLARVEAVLALLNGLKLRLSASAHPAPHPIPLPSALQQYRV